MKKTILATVVVAAMVGGLVAAPFGETARRHPRHTLKIVERLGSDVSVPPLEIRDAFVNCPRGYLPTGGSAFQGALDTVVQTTTRSRRGWVVTYGNPSDEAFTGSAFVICAKGVRKFRVRLASADEKAKAKAAWQEAHAK